MTEQQALELVRALLKARDESEVTRLVGQSLPALDGAFFTTAEAAARRLELDGKAAAATALRSLTDRMLRMKTLI
ncbi:MAG: hypothetical protein BWY52_02760 [Chloroflexi bacterium ADurb.Bin325]|nr:MAG: hypothetical protein BWY52_02760 [Chloroflexi bacterium ADurb.Bin325]